MTMFSTGDRLPRRVVPRDLVALAGLELGLALLSLGLDLARACGSCELGGGLRLLVAGAGVVGYLGLLLLGLRNAWAPFFVGAFAATGIHAALALLMILSGKFCLPCGAAAVVAIALGLRAAYVDRSRFTMAAAVTIPAAILTLGALFPSIAAAKDRAALRKDLHRTIRPPHSSLADGATVRLDVYEADHCPYCRDFRNLYYPRLSGDFGDSVEVRFHDAAGVRWIERTPTFLVDGVPVFEGLPHRYEDLREVLSVARAQR